jgi:signal transduction histidine kinase
LVNRTNSTEKRQLDLPSNWPKSAITGLVQDKQGLICASTNTNLLCFSPQGKPLRVYNFQEGLFAAPFQYKSLKMSDNGEIIVGGKNGISWFQPAQMQELSNKPKVQLTHCLIQGRPFREVFPSDSSITEKRYLRLKYRQNTFNFQVTGIEMGMPQDVKIQYYLRNWEDHRRASLYNQTTEARYEKLPPGTYQLRVRAASANGQWIPWQTKMTIQIIPPIWMRWWFIALGILSCVGILVLSVQSYYRAQLRDARIRNDEQERILRDIHDLTSGKVVFFQDFKAFAQTQIPQLEVKNKALDIAEQALQLFKRISAAVRNSLESDSTLLEFLTQIVAESRKILGGKVIFSAQLVPTIPYSWVSGETKKQLRFVVQEALGNILKHAEANKVSLTIAVNLGKLNITIQDDGKGIPEEVIAQIRPSDKVQVDGNGLGIMHGRILNLGGTIKWINDHGTKVIISISLQKVHP